MQTLRAVHLIERIANLLRAEQRAAGAAAGLQPVHLQLLDYLGRCNRYSDTLAAAAQYLGQTKGTVSQSLRVLEARGLIQRRADATDRRVNHLALTDSARALLASADSARVVEETADEVEANQLETLLASLLQSLLRRNGARPFGVCHSCRFFRRSATGFRCGLTDEPLSAVETSLICREHEPDPDADREPSGSIAVSPK